MTTYQSALLLGADYPDLGEVAVSELTEGLAIGLSRGRFPKGYSHVDPNEDGAFAATNGTTTLLAIADGHHGLDAAQAALESIAAAAPQVLGAPLALGTQRLLTVAAAAVNATVAELGPPRDKSGTALTICMVRAGDMATASLGDSGYAIATKRRVRVAVGQGDFLRPGTDATRARVVLESLPQVGLVVVASDGLFDFATTALKGALRESIAASAEDTVAGLIDLAGRGGAGDHLSIAALRLG